MRGRARSWMLAAAVLASGCLGPDDGSKDPETPTPSPGAAARPSAGGPETVTLDGGVVGLLWDAASAHHSVILLPGGAEPKEAFVPFAEQVFAAGARVLVIDGPDNVETGPAEAAFAHLRSVGAQQVVIVGASRRANAAMVFAADEPCIMAVGQLSPVPSEAELQAFERYGARPLFEGAAFTDNMAWIVAREHVETADGDVADVVGEDGAHGTELTAQAPFADALLAWLGGLSDESC